MKPEKERHFTGEEGEGVGSEAKSYDVEKALSSINHSILFTVASPPPQ
jgi:hypothetical protein